MAFCSPVPRNLIPPKAWRQLASDAHFAQFFDTGTALVDTVSEHLGAGLLAGASVVVIAKGERLALIETRLRDWGLQIDEAREWGHYTALDAARTLALFMRDGHADRALFRQAMEPHLARGAHARTVAFGEMVGLLWRECQYDAALHVEALWNELVAQYHLSLLCGYSADDMRVTADSSALHRVCAHHHAVIAPGLWPDS